MTQINNLSKAYGGKTLFSDVTFSIGKKERCALIGRNGTGKSTLIKLLAGLEESDSGDICHPQGSVIGTLPQHLTFTEATIVEEAQLGLPYEIKDEVYRVKKILTGLGFSENDFYQSPDSFSGGYQLRVALCKVLVGEPDLLLLDEPTNYLDIASIRWLERFLCNWQGKLLFISHDRAFLNRVCTHVIGINRSSVKKIKGNLNKYSELIESQEETYELTRQKLDKKKAHMQSFIEKFGAKASKAKQAQSKAKTIEKMGSMSQLQDDSTLSFSFNYKRFPGQLLLKAEDLQFSYEPTDSEEPLINQLSVSIEKGERLGIIGKNGRGKSTILRLLTEEISPQVGSVVIKENTSIGYFGQTNIEKLHPENTIEEELVADFPGVPYSKIRGACGVMLFSGDDAKKRISVLSGGERSRVLLAKILLTPTNLLILDEPTHHLDLESVEAFINALSNFPGSVILVSHDESVLNQLNPDKLIICHTNAQEVFLGDYPTFLEKKGWGDADKKTKNKKRDLTEKESKEAQKNRHQALKNIQKKTNQIEKKIELLDKEKNSLEETLATAAQENDQKAVRSTSAKLKETTATLDTLYEEFQSLINKEEELANS